VSSAKTCLETLPGSGNTVLLIETIR